MRPPISTRRQESRAQSAHIPRSHLEQHSDGSPGLQSHIFDGVNVTTETAAFQLCDIHDPMLKEMIEDQSGLRDICNVGPVTLMVEDVRLTLLIRNVMDGTAHMLWNKSRPSCVTSFSHCSKDTQRRMRSVAHYWNLNRMQYDYHWIRRRVGNQGSITWRKGHCLLKTQW